MVTKSWIRPVPSCSVPKLALPITRLSIRRPATLTAMACGSSSSFGSVAVLRMQVGGVVRGLEVVREGDALRGGSRPASRGARRSAGCRRRRWAAGVDRSVRGSSASFELRPCDFRRHARAPTPAIKSRVHARAAAAEACTASHADPVRRSPTASCASPWSAAAASRRTTSRRWRSTPSAPSWWRCATPTRPRWPPPSPRPARAGFASLDALLAGERRRHGRAGHAERPASAQAIEVARAGRHVMSEKPMATKWDEGVAMVRACRDAGVKLFVVKQNRLNATLQLRQARGRRRAASAASAWSPSTSSGPARRAYYDAAPWRGRWDMDGGAFMNQASHYVDMVDWLVGPVDNVHAYTATLARDIEAEDTGVMSLRLRSGALASINVTMLTHAQELRGQHHAARRARHGARRRRGGQQDRALGVRRRRTPRTRRSASASYGVDERLRPRPPAVLRQRDRHAARRGRMPRSTATRACARSRC